jgi:hypothetical protein
MTAMSRRTQDLVPRWTIASPLATWAHLAVVALAFCTMLTIARALRARRQEHDIVIARLKSYCAWESGRPSITRFTDRERENRLLAVAERAM